MRTSWCPKTLSGFRTIPINRAQLYQGDTSQFPVVGSGYQGIRMSGVRVNEVWLYLHSCLWMQIHAWRGLIKKEWSLIVILLALPVQIPAAFLYLKTLDLSQLVQSVWAFPFLQPPCVAWSQSAWQAVNIWMEVNSSSNYSNNQMNFLQIIICLQHT